MQNGITSYKSNYIVWELWPDTREFITKTVELWTRLNCHVITTENSSRVHCIHMYHLICYALVHVIYSRVSGQYSHAVLWTNIDQKLINSLHGLLNCEIGGLDCRVITTEYKTRVHCIHMYHLFCYALVHVIYSRVSCQYSHAVQGCFISNECYMSGCV